MSHISFVSLLLYVPYMQNFTHKKMHACKAAAGGPLLEISYIPLLSVMTLHYHRLYQISCLAANLSLEDLKQLCRQKPPSQVYLPTPKLIIKPDLF